MLSIGSDDLGEGFYWTDFISLLGGVYSIMSGHTDDMMLNGDEGTIQSIPYLVVGTTDVVYPSSVAKANDRLMPQSLLAMPIARTTGITVPQGDSVLAMPVIHLHQHEHVVGTVDKEARAIVDRLAA